MCPPPVGAVFDLLLRFAPTETIGALGDDGALSDDGAPGATPDTAPETP